MTKSILRPFAKASHAKALAVALTLAAGAFATTAYAEEQPAAAPSEAPSFAYTVTEENARIPFGPGQINSFRVGRDGSLLLRTGVSNWYRATLFQPCARDLRWEQEIAIGDQSHSSVDRFSFAIVDGQRCQFRTFDRISDPREAERAADAASGA